MRANPARHDIRAAAARLTHQHPGVRSALATLIQVSSKRAELQGVLDRVISGLPPAPVYPFEPTVRPLHVSQVQATEPRRGSSFPLGGEGRALSLSLGFIGFVAATGAVIADPWATHPLAIVAGTTAALGAAPWLMLRVCSAVSHARAALANCRTRVSEGVEHQRLTALDQQESPLREAEQEAHQAWQDEVAMLKAAHADTIDARMLTPFSEAVARIDDPALRAAALARLHPALLALRHERATQLTLGAAATLDVLVCEAHRAKDRKHVPLVELGMALRHIDPGLHEHREYVRGYLRALPENERAVVARRIQSQYFTADACKVPGEREEQIRTLVMLKSFQT